jgi:hypothetical protein
MEPITIRSIERILVVLIGGLCAYLGYRLFLHIPHQNDGEGKVKLPGGISIFFTRVGPGVFFALFGAGVVAFSLYQGVVYFREKPSDTGTQKKEGEVSRSDIEYYGGMTQRDSRSEAKNLEEERFRLRLNVEFLNTLPSLLRTNLDGAQRQELTRRITNTKLALMKTVWGPDWDNFEEFTAWAESGGADPVPQKLAGPAGYYRHGQEAPK